MKKTLFLVTMVALFVAAPVLAVEETNETAKESRSRLRSSSNEDIQELQTKIQELKTARQEVRETARLQAATSAKTAAILRLDRLMLRFKALEKKVNAMTSLTEEEKTNINTKIEAQITKLQASKTTLQNATTIEQIKTVMKQVRADVKASMTEIKALIKEARGTRMHNLTKHLTIILNKLVAKADAINPNSTAIDTLETDTKTHIAAADAAIDKADYETARTEITEAKINLHAMIKEIKALKAEATPDQETGTPTNTTTGNE